MSCFLFCNPTGAVFIYTISSADYVLIQKIDVASYITSTTSRFGCSVSLDYDASTLAVGAPQEDSMQGRLYVFKQRTDGQFRLVETLSDLVATSGESYSSQLGGSLAISANGRTGERHPLIGRRLAVFCM